MSNDHLVSLFATNLLNAHFIGLSTEINDLTYERCLEVAGHAFVLAATPVEF